MLGFNVQARKPDHISRITCVSTILGGSAGICIAVFTEQPCKMPFKMRYSIESLGGKVDQTIEDLFGYKIKYAKDGKLPEYLIFVGGLLYDKK